MKKNIALFISMITLILLIVFLRVDIKKEPTGLSGQLLSNAIYGYDLETDGLSINGFKFLDEEVYYLLMDVIDEEDGVYNYTLKKLDIYENKIITINSLKEWDSYCSLQENNIYCSSSNGFQVFNLNLEEIFSYTSSSATISNYVPYKDIYLKVDDLSLYLIRNNKEELYRQINTDINLLYEDYFVTENNTYLLYFDEEGNYYIYDVNKNNLTSIHQDNYIKYSKGLFFYDELEYQVYDLINNKTILYENILQEDYYFTGTMNNESTIAYLYDIIDNVLYFEDLENETLQELDTTIFSPDNPIANIYRTEEYLYIYVLQDENNFFVIDLENLELPKMNMEEYTDELVNSINTIINQIQEQYQVNINIKENAIIEFPDFSAEVLTNNELILESLTKVETILSKYDQEFFKSFYDEYYEGLNIYLTGSLTPSDYETQAANPAAYSLMYNNQYMIVIDLNQPNIEELLCHELLHNLEFNLNNHNIYPFSEWNDYNPPNFYYNNSYTSNSNLNYTLSEENKTNVYFIDYYSHTYATEDRARVFERICSCTEDSIVNDYPHLYQKGLYLEEEITKYYPELKNTSLFNSLN